MDIGRTGHATKQEKNLEPEASRGGESLSCPVFAVLRRIFGICGMLTGGVICIATSDPTIMNTATGLGFAALGVKGS